MHGHHLLRLLAVLGFSHSAVSHKEALPGNGDCKSGTELISLNGLGKDVTLIREVCFLCIPTDLLSPDSHAFSVLYLG